MTDFPSSSTLLRLPYQRVLLATRSGSPSQVAVERARVVVEQCGVTLQHLVSALKPIAALIAR